MVDTSLDGAEWKDPEGAYLPFGPNAYWRTQNCWHLLRPRYLKFSAAIRQP